MFRAAQSNPFDEVVGKATDENLTSENWEYILDVCDKVNSGDTGGKDAVAAMIKRLAHRNANVQIYTLELAHALAQNCGSKIHKELASRSFTDALLRLANDRNTHTQVKAKILERMSEWAEMFSKEPDYGIMEQAYMRLRSENPSLQPPSKPFKQEITATDRQKEEEELQMALALSVKESKATPSQDPKSPTPAAERTSSISQPAAAAAMPTGTTAATVSRVRALYDFTPSEPGELAFQRGDIIAVLESVYKDWWKGSLRGQTGIFPLNYVEKLQDPTQDELQREAEMEAEVFGQIKNVEKLLALLSTSSNDISARDNDEITSLYHSTLSIRPKLIELIGKYSQKKDDFTQLNEKFIKARRDYENLLEVSMSHPQQSGYGRPAPPQQYGYGAPPPQQHYPQQQQQQPYYPPHQPPQTVSSPPPQQPYSDPSIPPRNGPAPFYMIPPGQQPPHAPVDQQQPHDAQQAGVGHPQQPPQSSYPPVRQASTASRHSVQELAASESQPLQTQQTGDSAYPAPLNVHHPQQPAYGGAPSQPAYAPPAVPSELQQPPPPQPQQQPPQQQQQQVYQPYVPPGLQPGHAPQQTYGGATGQPAYSGLRSGGDEDVDSYYR